MIYTKFIIWMINSIITIIITTLLTVPNLIINTWKLGGHTASLILYQQINTIKNKSIQLITQPIITFNQHRNLNI